MNKLLLGIIFFLYAVSNSGAAEPSVEVAAIATSVENLTPVGVSDKFPSSAGKLYCYSKITDAEGQNIKHIWHLNDKKIAEKVLSIKGKRYRTFSVLTISKGMKGTGRCDVTTEDGKVLKSVDFVIE